MVAGGGTGYPGVAVRNEGGGAVPRQKIAVTLPPEMELQFESEAGTVYQLTVYDTQGNQVNYPGNLSGNTLNFMNVDLSLPGMGSAAAVWVAVTARSIAPAGNTNLTFTIGGQRSTSSLISVTRP